MRLNGLLLSPVRIIFAFFSSMLIGGCAGSLDIQWEEEVPINEKQTIWVKRTDQFNARGEPGNPFRLAWALHKRKYEFDFQGKRFVYSLEVQSSPGVFLIYGDEKTAEVTIIDYSRSCRKPGFAEYRWTVGGWRIQRNLRPDFIGVSRNVMQFSSAEGEIPLRLSLAAKEGLHLNSPSILHAETVLASENVAQDCPEGGK